MKVVVHGNIVEIVLTNEENMIDVPLPYGYSLESIIVDAVINVNQIIKGCNTYSSQEIIFPVVNSKSPCVLHVAKQKPSAEAYTSFTISKFGQIPDPHYFDHAFDPILVTGDDGNEYPIIPSEQFK